MRALVYHGPKNVSVDEVPDAMIERPTDALIKITTHQYLRQRSAHVRGPHRRRGGQGPRPREPRAGDRGRRRRRPGQGGRHGVSAVQHRLRILQELRGGPDRVSASPPIPATPALRTGTPTWAPTTAGRPNCCACRTLIGMPLSCPKTRRRRRNDYVMLSDILPTGYHGTELAAVGIGDRSSSTAPDRSV